MSIKYKVIILVISFFTSFTHADERPKLGMGLIPADKATYENIPDFALPDSIDRNIPKSYRFSSLPNPGNQGAQGSCTGWAVAFAAKSVTESIRQKKKIENNNDLYSPSYLYNQTKYKGCDDGAVIKIVLDFLVVNGVANLNDFPYDENNCVALPNAEQIKTAKQNNILDYDKVIDFKPDTSTSIPQSDINDIKILLANDFPVIVGMNVTQGLGDWWYKGPNDVYKGHDNKETGGHAMTVVGYDDNKNAFLIMNSWGKFWGNNGFLWIDYNTFAKLTLEAYVISEKKA